MKSKFFAVLATLSLSSFALAAEVKIVSINGSGCPDSGKTIPTAFDGQWLTVELNQAAPIKVSKGAGISLEESRKNCQIVVDVNAPGHRYAVERVVTWGSYQLAASDQLVTSLDGYFQAEAKTFSADSQAFGPALSQQHYYFDRTLSGSNLIWSDCDEDRPLNLNTAVRVSPKANGGYAASSKGSLDRVAFRFIYQKCY